MYIIYGGIGHPKCNFKRIPARSVILSGECQPVNWGRPRKLMAGRQKLVVWADVSPFTRFSGSMLVFGCVINFVETTRITFWGTPVLRTVFGL